MSTKRAPLLASNFILKQRRSAGREDEPETTDDDSGTGGRERSTIRPKWSRPLHLERMSKPRRLNTVAPSHRDVLCEAIATAQTLRELQVVHGSLIEMKLERLGTTCIARLYASDEDEYLDTTDQASSSSESKQGPTASFLDNVLYVPPTICFNLGINAVLRTLEMPLHIPSCIRLRRWNPPRDVTLNRRALTSQGTSEPTIPCAKRVHLARVASPISSGYKSYSQTLQMYFHQTRILREGQVFGDPSDCEAYRDSDCWMYSPNVDVDNLRNSLLDQTHDSLDVTSLSAGLFGAPRIPLIFFRVMKVHPFLSYFQVDPRSTTMIQEGVSQSRVPFEAEFYLHKSPNLPKIPPPLTQYRSKLITLLIPFLHAQTDKSKLKCRILVTGSRRSLKRVLVASVARHLGLHLVECNLYNLLEASERQTAKNLMSWLKEAVKCKPAIVHLRRINAIADHAQAHQQTESQLLAVLVKDLTNELKLLHSTDDLGPDPAVKHPVLLIASCENQKQLPTKLQSVFSHQINIVPPDTKARGEMFQKSLSEAGRNENDDDTRELAQLMAAKTAGISAGEIRYIVGLADSLRLQAAGNQKRSVELGKSTIYVPNGVAREAAGVSDGLQNGDLKTHHLNGNHSSPNEQQSVRSDGQELDINHLQESLKEFQARASTGSALAKIPNVKWKDVGGLEHVKREILDTIQLPLQHPELFSKGLKKRSGILLYGPPGTGKTLIAKAVATECSLNFISVKGPELLNMYIGESEKNVRDVFERARNAKPCVLFFDEMDSVAPKRGQGSDSGGVMDRVVSQLLTELDGMSNSNDVFIIGATNRPDLVDTALTRPGRLDRLVYLGVSDTRESQLKIVKALTRKFRLDKDVDLGKIVERCSFNFTGADFYALCSDAMLNALKRKIRDVDNVVYERKKRNEHSSKEVEITARSVLDEMPEEQLQVVVKLDDFERARSRLNPSLSQEELDHYVQLQKQYELNKKR